MENKLHENVSKKVSTRPVLGCIEAKVCKAIANTCKYSLESSRQDLHNALLCTVFESQFFRQTIAKFSSFFSQFLLFFRDFARFFRNFAKFLPEFLEISRKSIKFANFYEFYGVRDKTRTQIRRRPIVRSLDGVEVAVRGPSPGEGEREKG